MLETEPAPAARDVFGRSWDGCRVTVVGLGRSGIAAAELLRRQGARVRVTESKDSDALQAARVLLESRGIEEAELGGHTERLIEESEAVIVSPGVPESSGPIQWAIRRRLPILSEIELAFHFCPSPIIAVTGTNGKSTAVTLIAALLHASGRSAIACGNLGVPFSSIVGSLTSGVLAVVEVSSFQLLWCHQFRPKVGVLLNIGTNHLDRHQDAQAYLSAKSRLFQRQTPEDWAVLNGRDPRIAALGDQLHAQRVWVGENRSNSPALWLAPETQRSLTESAQAVLQVGRLMGIPDPLTWQVIRTFRGLEHRLERVATVRGVHFVNDSKSTTPDSLLFALARTPGRVVVIVGGRDKGLEFGPMIERLHDDRVKGVVLIGESRERLRRFLNGSIPRREPHPGPWGSCSGSSRASEASRGTTLVRDARTLQEAVRVAAELAGPGATVLLSPACASFDMFRDFEERGRMFKAIVSELDGTG